MDVLAEGEVVCGNRHSFTIAKQGYVNFLTRAVRSMYTKNLFESRKMVIDAGLYNTLHNEIAKIIGNSATAILDTGCGEGSHLVNVCELLNDEVVGVGMDIAKEGILTAAKYYEKKIWCVGDLACSPFREQSFDYILNILSPANYGEFNRLLKNGGKVIKVVPQSGYLQELRNKFLLIPRKRIILMNRPSKDFMSNFWMQKDIGLRTKCQLRKNLFQN
ncbi:methyltransferase domain-containing protein [Ureibacillus thermophilus]|uniref:methyltransferase domain-containing protein n=1 Tax=Ureibacillus thermophilus TaxID=367743 RepID=UPI00319E5929